jgi:hypothetical protein
MRILAAPEWRALPSPFLVKPPALLSSVVGRIMLDRTSRRNAVQCFLHRIAEALGLVLIAPQYHILLLFPSPLCHAELGHGVMFPERDPL